MNSKKYFENKYILIIAIVALYTLTIVGVSMVPIEEVDIVDGVSYDIQKKSSDIIKYVFPFSITVFFQNGKRTNKINIGEGLTVGDTIQNRQRELNKKFIQGLEKVFVISEEYASNGIRNMLDERSRSSLASDMAFGMVCRGKSEDIIGAKLKGFPSASDYLYGLINNAQQENFFSENYKIIDMFVRVDAEGRNLVLPYVQKKEDSIEIAGLALFKGDKMVCNIGIEDARLLNMLRDSDVLGTLSISKNPKQYIDMQVESKRKVNCEKKGEKYYFTINLDMKGDIIDNELYYDIKDNLKTRKEFEKEISKKTEEECNEFINKMKNQYKVDCLELGRKAASKYGRRKENNWSEIICNSDIKVNVKVEVSRQGRGDI